MVTPAHPFRRWTARLLDWVLVLVVTAPIWVFAVGHVKHAAALGTASLTDDGASSVLTADWEALSDGATTELQNLWQVTSLTVTGAILVQVVALALYETLMHRFLGRTLGKMALSVKVVGAQGTKLTSWQVLARSLLTTLLPGAGWALFAGGFVWLEPLMMIAGVALVLLSALECVLLRDGRTWHDRRTRTAVVRTSVLRQGIALAQQTWQAPQTQQALHQVRDGVQRMRDGLRKEP